VNIPLPISLKKSEIDKGLLSLATYRRLLKHALPYKWRMIAGILCGILFAGTTFGSLPAMKELFGRVFDYEHAGIREVTFFSIILLVIVFFRGVGEYLSNYLLLWVGNRVIMDLRTGVFTHLQNLSVAYFDKNKTSEVISRTINDTSLLEWALSMILLDIAREPLMLIGSVGVIFWLNWQLALATILLFPLCLIPIVLFGRKVRKAGREGQEYLAETLGVMQETVGGVRIVKAFGMEEHENKRFANYCKSVFTRVMRVVRAKSMIEPVIFLLSAIGLIMALFYAKACGMKQEEFFTFGIALVIMYGPVKKLSRLHLVIQHCSAAADRVFEILDTKSSVLEVENAKDLEGIIKEICFDNVSFDYGNGPVLQNINLSVQAGQKIAIVGESGSGKTTLINLLPRFFDPTHGKILINGENIKNYTLRSLRRQMGLVTQDTFLFNDTVANNIAYGTSGVSLEQVKEAARKAHASEFVEKMEGGYNAVVGERGVKLSGGQKQRLAIARAILRDPPILILDEATSSLDTEAERIVQEAIDEVMAGKTVFAIAHRISTIAHFDVIVVLHKGRIAEIGTHSQLLDLNGIYYKMFKIQFERFGNGGNG